MCASAWQEYREDHKGLGKTKCLLDFKTDIAESLLQEGKTTHKRKGRLSISVDTLFREKVRKGWAKPIPSVGVRMDELGIFRIMLPTKGGAKCQDAKASQKLRV